MQYDYLEALVKDLSLYKIKTEINMKNLRIWQTLSLFILLLSITLPLSAKSDLLTEVEYNYLYHPYPIVRDLSLCGKVFVTFQTAIRS